MFLLAAITALSLLLEVHASDAFKTMEEYCQENNFKVESYNITTSDDYILSLYRIPGMIGEVEPSTPKPVVHFQHGWNGDMMQWVINNPEGANAFILAKEGYDVWLGNNRGSAYGVHHKTLTTKDREFWNFYQRDMAEKDLPAFIDFILEKTGVETISYVGHSEGTT